jgi:endoribonuclease Dicer
LRYKFRNPKLLLEAFTHRSARDPLDIGVCYEKLEVLGDAILDFLCNYTLLHYTLFERYKTKNTSVYQLEEDFVCGDAHQAKALLVKNEVLAKLCVLLGFHRYVVLADAGDGNATKKDVGDYLKYSFHPNFKLNQREIEPFECPKILGDIFESVVGAIFIDSPRGLLDVVEVFRHLISPFILYVAKFSKVLYKEHKEEFIWASIAKKIRPQFRFSDELVPITVNSE